MGTDVLAGLCPGAGHVRCCPTGSKAPRSATAATSLAAQPPTRGVVKGATVADDGATPTPTAAAGSTAGGAHKPFLIDTSPPIPGYVNDGPSIRHDLYESWQWAQFFFRGWAFFLASWSR